MSWRRLNFTERRSIPKNAVRLCVHPGPPRTFDLEVDLTAQRFPADARVFVEVVAAGSPLIERYDFGTVQAIAPVSDCTIRSITSPRIRFIVKVVDVTDRPGRLLGILDDLRPTRDQVEDARVSLLTTELVPLGERVWRLFFAAEEVVLQLNDAIPGIMTKVAADPVFAGLLYPEIVRQVLERIVTAEGITQPEAGSNHWTSTWLEFAQLCHPEGLAPPEAATASMSAARDELDQWISEVADAVAEHWQLATRIRSHEEVAP
ncbi:MAG: hypothetical protein KF817_12830 [Phycisphaeraceae bacterium]|nr:hypothetical protein [Phycisphaeraceae bacterium]